jgi:hypothetical protein
MTYAVNTHDCWGVVKVGNYQSIEEARTVFADQCDDLRDKSDGTVRGVELVLGALIGSLGGRLRWGGVQKWRDQRLF